MMMARSLTLCVFVIMCHKRNLDEKHYAAIATSGAAYPPMPKIKITDNN